MKKALLVVACRPNFMKAAPLFEELKKDGTFETCLVHTGQHTDKNMSDVFFKDLDMPKPDYLLKDIRELNDVIKKEAPTFVVVFGDVNSTADSAIIASRLKVPVVHIEAGLRSFNKEMLEEKNRIITDHISDLLFVTEEAGVRNLRRAEGIDENKVFLVGSLMIDTLIKYKEVAVMRPKREGKYCVLTLHRAENVDDRVVLKHLLETFKEIQKKIDVVWPLHPRTKKMVELFGLDTGELIVIEPLGYLDMLNLMMYSGFVMTDSGGIQEETSYLNIPCVTLRNETEKPSTVEYGTNTLVGWDRKEILSAIKKHKMCVRNKLDDGKVAERIVKILRNVYS